MATAAATGIFNQLMARQTSTEKAATPMSGSTSGTGGSNGTGSASGDSATISSNDFLTLLVTEMQNQDPTANTDPNEYINQLVQVNSLEQLIDINQTLSGTLGSTSANTGGDASGKVAGTNTGSTSARNLSTTASAATPSAGAPVAGQAGAAVQRGSGAKHAPGNLSIPGAQPAARRVAHSLSGRTHAHPAMGR